MKKLFFSLVATMLATVSFAQSTLVATLSHEGNISMYYGTNALINAHTAAMHGDVITLSSGSFLPVNITKAVTIRGASMGVADAIQVEPTILSGNFYVDISDTTTAQLTIEGIYHNHSISIGHLKDAKFHKCRLWYINYKDSALIQNLMIINCRIVSNLYCPSNSSVVCINSAIGYPDSDNTTHFEFTNCIIHKPNIGSNVYNSYFKNCILVGNSSSSNYLNSTCVAYNCLNVDTSSSSIFRNVLNSTNYHDNYKNVFTSYAGGYFVDGENFELTDMAKETYLGMDGTQVGVLGGSLPFTAYLANPQITRCTVASKSTADGKLSVDIEVNGNKQ